MTDGTIYPYIEVVDLDRYQHYKSRDITTWVKLECKMLRKGSTFELREVDRWRFIALLVLGVENDNRIKYDTRWLHKEVCLSRYPIRRSWDKTIIALKEQGLISIHGIDQVYTPSISKEGSKEVGKKGLLLTAERLYEVYKQEIKPGARADAIRNIERLLKADIPEKELLNHITAYKQHLTKTRSVDPKYYIQANNFFGRAERWKEFKPIESKHKSPNPNCKLCQGKGLVWVPAKSAMEICSCRKK